MRGVLPSLFGASGARPISRSHRTTSAEQITAEVIDLVRAGKVRPVIGSVVGFDEVPQAIDDLANRRTSGRVVIQLEG